MTIQVLESEQVLYTDLFDGAHCTDNFYKYDYKFACFNIFILCSLLIHSYNFFLIFSYECFMISWLLLAVRMILEIVLQFLWGSYDGYQRSFILIITHFLGFITFQIAQSEYPYNMVRITKSEQRVFSSKKQDLQKSNMIERKKNTYDNAWKRIDNNIILLISIFLFIPVMIPVGYGKIP